MTDSSALVDGIVAALRDIPELVAEMDGDVGRIYAYHDLYPRKPSLQFAIHQMPAPSVMVAWQGTEIGSMGAADAWKHRFALYLRAKETFEGDAPTGYYRLFHLIVNGVPSSSGQRLLYTTIHENCYPMDPPSIARQTDAEGLDYFEVSVTLTEIGDY